MANKYDYIELRDLDTDDRQYHAKSFENFAACACCGDPTSDACVLCGSRRCFHCLFNLRVPELADDDPDMVETEWGPARAEPDYEWGRVCLECYIKHEGNPPYSWGWPNYRAFAFLPPKDFIRPGSSIPAGDFHSLISDSQAAPVIMLNHMDDFEGKTYPASLNAFEMVSLFAWMQAWQSEIKRIADEASTALVKYQNRMHQLALEADSGHINWSQFE